MSSNTISSFQSNNNNNNNSPLRDPTSPSRNLLSTSKSSWCSSPFSNLVTLSPDSHSLTFSLADLSPSMAFSSPRNRFPTELSSPQSSTRLPKDIPSCSLFSPSLFSPFNKSLNPHKMDKFTDDFDPTPNSRLITGIEDTPDHLLFHHSHNILPHLLKTTDDRSDTHPSQGNNLNVNGFDLEEVSNDDHLRIKKLTESNITIPSKLSLLSSTSTLSSLLPSTTGTTTTTMSIPTVNIGLMDVSHSVDMKSPVNRIQLHIPYDSEHFYNSNGNYNTQHQPQQQQQQNHLSKDTPPMTKFQQLNGTKIVSPPSKNMPFLSPAVTAKPKQTNMSPNMDQRNHCNCKKSKCLKLYCECFAALRYCSSCNCSECNNCKEFESVRQEAVQLTRERNPSAFQMKVSVKKGHMAGCNCKKSRCLKKYCECFEGSVFCGPNCKCVECQNLAGSDALKQAKSSLNKEKRDKLFSPRNDTNDSDEEKIIINGVHNNNGIVIKSKSPETLTKSYDDVTDTPFKIRSRSFTSNDNQNESNVYVNNISMRDMLLPSVSNLSHNPLSPHHPSLSSSSPSVATLTTIPSTSISTLTLTLPPEESSPLKSDNHSILTNSESDLSSESPSRSSTCTNSSVTESPDTSNNPTDSRPIKKRRTENGIKEVREPVYPFFGSSYPPTTKLIALSCLEYLDGPSLYAMSCVNHLWCQAVMDDALWE